MANKIFNRDTSSVLTIINDPEVISSLSDKAKQFSINFVSKFAPFMIFSDLYGAQALLSENLTTQSFKTQEKFHSA